MRFFDSMAEKEERVLAYLQEHPGLNYATDICASTGYFSGTLYPILNTLRAQGLVEREWVDQADGRSRRMGYRYVEDSDGHRIRQPREIRRRRYGLAWGAA